MEARAPACTPLAWPWRAFLGLVYTHLVGADLPVVSVTVQLLVTCLGVFLELGCIHSAQLLGG